MEALVYLRPATEADMVFEGKLIENRVHFYKSMVTGNFCGPYEVLCPDDDITQMVSQVQLGMIYVPHYELLVNCMSCTMHFMEALGADLKYKETLKLNFSYWIASDGMLIGPYQLSEKTNTSDLAALLIEERIFILAHKSTQAFPELNAITKAS
ncbi:MAG: hypothetical protein V4581_16755 [Bacteroidota bacterium]